MTRNKIIFHCQRHHLICKYYLSISLRYRDYKLWSALQSIGLTYSQVECSSTSKNSKTTFNGGRIETEYAQSMLAGYCSGYPGLFSVLLITEPHSVKAQEQQIFDDQLKIINAEQLGNIEHQTINRSQRMFRLPALTTYMYVLILISCTMSRFLENLKINKSPNLLYRPKN